MELEQSKDSFDAVLVCQRVDQRLKKEISEAHLEPVEQGGASAAAVVVLGEHLVGINVGLTNVLLVYRDVKNATIQADRHSPSSPEEEKRIVAGGAKVEGGKAVALGKTVPASRCFGMYRLKQETVINVLTTTPWEKEKVPRKDLLAFLLHYGFEKTSPKELEQKIRSKKEERKTPETVAEDMVKEEVDARTDSATNVVAVVGYL